MKLPRNFRYTEEHEWILVKGDEATVGITDYAQGELGDVVFIEVPSVGTSFKKGDVVASIEAVKTVAEVYSPVSGIITTVNEKLDDTPEAINEDPYGKGWIFKVKLSDSGELEDLLTPDKYQDLVE